MAVGPGIPCRNCSHPLNLHEGGPSAWGAECLACASCEGFDPDHTGPARDSQVGGDHYKRYKIQPWDIWEEYDLDAFTGAILKYLLRDKADRLEDLKKARHTLDRLIEIEENARK